MGMENMEVNSLTQLTGMMAQLYVLVSIQGARDTTEHITPSPCPYNTYMLMSETLIGSLKSKQM